MKVKTKHKIKKIALNVCVVIVIFVLVVGVFKISASAAVGGNIDQDLLYPATCNHNYSLKGFYYDSMYCKHVYVCEYCNSTKDDDGMYVKHGILDNGSCQYCGYSCFNGHSFYKNGNPDGYCARCGYKCQHSNKTLTSYDQNNNLTHIAHYHCNVCGLDLSSETVHMFTNCVCACGKSHFWVDGVCNLCNVSCSHSEMLAPMKYCPTCNYCAGGHDYVNSICKNCGASCSHSFETVITVRNLDTHKIATRCVYCAYESWFEYDYHDFKNGVCVDCSYECVHTFEPISTGGQLIYICTHCGDACEHSSSSTHYDINGENSHRFYDVCNDCGFKSPESYENCLFSDGNCKYCGQKCPHEFVASSCIMCGAKCDHVYNGNTCNICGWACDGGHNFYNNGEPQGYCTSCGYVCQHSLGYEWRVNYDQNSHYDARVCRGCGIVVEVGDKTPHTLVYYASDDGCHCQDCDYFRKHSVVNLSSAFKHESLNTYKHRDYYRFDCCGFIYTEDVDHTFIGGSQSDFKCTVCGAYSITAENLYNIGYNNGLADGADMDSGSIAQGMIFGIYDGMTNTFFSMLGYEIFGINIAQLIISLIAIVLVVFVVKKVI